MVNPKKASGVFAIVVTYNPDRNLRNRLQMLRDQVEAVLIVDNGSDDVKFIEEAAVATDCQVLLNRANLGMAAALNQGVRAAEEQGAIWLATFDQDSQVPTNGIGNLLSSARHLPHADRIAILAMSHADSNTGRDYHRPGEILHREGEWKELRTTITSGSLLKMSAFNDVGLFDEKLFIDMVDIDFCLRCRQKGLMVMESSAVTLAHSLGDSTIRNVLGRPIVLTRHSPLRRYYITRNQLEMCRRYVSTDIRWVWGSLWDLSSGSLLVLLLEEHRYEKLSSMLAGARDFLLRRFGPKLRESA